MSIPKELAREADRHGLVVQECGAGHFQILGGKLIVNYYPESRRKSAYIQGMKAAHHHVDVKRAVALALEPQGIPTKTERRGKYRKIKLRLFRKSPICYRCKRVILRPEDATVEHIVPLSQGGLDHHNNMAISHERCNHAAGNEMPKGRK